MRVAMFKCVMIWTLGQERADISRLKDLSECGHGGGLKVFVNSSLCVHCSFLPSAVDFTLFTLAAHEFNKYSKQACFGKSRSVMYFTHITQTNSMKINCRAPRKGNPQSETEITLIY